MHCSAGGAQEVLQRCRTVQRAPHQPGHSGAIPAVAGGPHASNSRRRPDRVHVRLGAVRRRYAACSRSRAGRAAALFVRAALAAPLRRQDLYLSGVLCVNRGVCEVLYNNSSVKSVAWVGVSD